MEIIKVKILEDGVSAQEINHLGKKPERLVPFYSSKRGYTERERNIIKEYNKNIKQWEEVENSLRTFQIEFTEQQTEVWYTIDGHLFLPESIYTAEIIDNNKLIIRII